MTENQAVPTGLQAMKATSVLLGRPRVGTLAWLERTGGRLAPRDRIRLLGQGVVAQLVDLPLPVGGRLGLTRPQRLRAFDPASVRLPDSRACRHAEQLCEQMRPQFLINHSYRTYLWAAAVAAQQRLRFDEEVVYVSSLLHDLGLSETHRRAVPTCFTWVGADAAQRAGAKFAWSEKRQALAAEAVTLHMNLRVPQRRGVEAYLVAAGTQLDAVGARYWTVPADARTAVVARYPRDGAKAGFVRLFGEQAKTQPGSRAQFYWRYLSLRRRLRIAPFE